MTKQEFLAKLSEKINGFTIYSAAEHYPFGQDLNRYWDENGQRIQGVPFPSYPVNSRGLKETNGNLLSTSYDIKRDIRVSDMLADSSPKDRELSDIIYFIALTVISSFCTYSINIPDTEQLKKIIALSGYNFNELNRRASGIPNRYLSSFSGFTQRQIAIILFELLLDTLDECAGIDRYKTKQYSKKVKVEFARERLLKVIDYMQLENLFEFDSLPISILTNKKIDRYALGEIDYIDYENGDFDTKILDEEAYKIDFVTDEKADELKREAQKAYEEYVLSYGVDHFKKVISNREMEGLNKKIITEEGRLAKQFVDEMHRLGRLLKKLERESRNQPKKPDNILIPNTGVFADGIRPVTPASKFEALESALENIGDANIAELHEKFLNVILSSQTTFEEMKPITEYLKRSIAAAKALGEYEGKIRGETEKLIVSIYTEESSPISTDRLKEISESLLIAVLCDDELPKLTCYKYFLVFFTSVGNLPICAGDFPELEDEGEWEDDFYFGDNGNLETQIVGEDDIVEIAIPNVPLKHPIKVSSAIARLAECRFDTPLTIRNSIVKAFRNLGVPEQQARDYAIIVASMRMMRMRDDYIPDGYDYFPENLDANIIDDGERDEEIELLKKEKSDALKKVKSSEKEEQRLRHELADLQRKYSKLETELQRSNDLLEEYEQRDLSEDEDTDINEQITQTVDFPYHTDLKVVLYGGFNVFHQELVKLLPDIRIIPYSSRFDLAPFKNADLVVMQINRTSHSRYWAVLDCVRAENIPYIHLRNASAEICAYKIIEEINKLTDKK